MSYSLITGMPVWFVLLCILLGIIYAGILYFRNKKDEYPLWLTRWMALLRFVSVFIISFLLLSPLVKVSKNKTEKPILIIAVDNSSSMKYYESDKWVYNNLNDFVFDFQDFEVHKYTFGDRSELIEDDKLDSANLSFSEKYTTVTPLLEEINDSYYKRNVGAVILVTDGIVNRGLNPLYMQDEFEFPLYTLAMGDTSIKKDAKISLVNHNSIAYKGNDFPVEVIVQADNCQGEELEISVLYDGERIRNESMTIQSKRQSGLFDITLTAKNSGIEKYEILLEGISDETNLINNGKTIYIDVLDEQMNVAIIANSPHPDVSALKEAINSNYSFLAEDFMLDEFTQSFEKYNLVILHQIPSSSSLSVKLANDLIQSEVPLLFIIGEQTNLKVFNSLDAGLSIISGNTSGVNEAQPLYNEFFSYYQLGDRSVELLPKLPPLYTPFADYKINSEGEVLFFQEVLGVSTSNPLIFCSANLSQRKAFIAGDGIWRWKLKDYALTQNHESFREIVNKLVKFLALQVDKRQFKIVYNHQTEENQNIVLRAELYNEIYEKVPGNEIMLSMANENGQEFSYQFSSIDDDYVLDIGVMPPGKYTFEAKTSLGDKVFTDKGEFSVLPLKLEDVNTIADHRLLYNLAEKNQGTLFYPHQVNDLKDSLKESEEIKPLIYSRKTYTDLIDIPWILAFILILLSLEWIMRKWGGSY